MARSRSSIAELVRLLDGISQPIYVLDDDRTIVFCNPACSDWLRKSSEELLGLRCTYRSGEKEDLDATASGLCPSPNAFAGRENQGIVSCRNGEGELNRRQARFVPLRSDGDSVAGLIVLVDRRALSESEAIRAISSDNEAARLHELIRTYRHRAAARYRIDRLIGDSPAIRQARAQVEVAVSNRASVVIVGPPGTGRQHIASTIHYGCSPESAGPLIPLACSVLGAELIRSTIGAIASRPAHGDRSNVGSLLLNDVDQLPLEVQAELARALSERSFPMRILGTARQRLTDLVRRGEYREDLAALLCTIVIEAPPLARRRADVPLLVQAFLEEANARGGKQIAGLTPDAMDCLDAYPWPGNVDELMRFVEEAHKRSDGPEIGVRDLPQQVHLAARAAAHPRRAEETIVLDEFLQRVERELLERALARAKGNKTKAAKLLGLTRPRLYRRMVQLGLEENSDRRLSGGDAVSK